MSDKSKDKKAEAAPAADGHGAAKKGGIGALLTKLPVLLGGAMVIEAAVLFGAFKMMGGGAGSADGATLHTTDTHGAGGDEYVEEAASAAGGHGGGHGGGSGDAAAGPRMKKKEQYPMPVIEFRAPNRVGGRQMLFDVSIQVQVRGENFAKVKARIEQQKPLISDRIRTIIAQSDPEKLNGNAEPGLETLKRQVKYQLDEIVGDGLVEEVIVPRCIPFRADL